MSYKYSGCSSLTSIIIPYSVNEIQHNVFAGCSGLTSIVVDSENPNYDSRSNCNAIIQTEANTLILGCKNTIIPYGVKAIGGGAFKGCTDLISITIPNSVNEIGAAAFKDCSGLTSFIIPNSVTRIMNDGVFQNCSALTTVTIGCSVKSLYSNTFSGCSSLMSIISKITTPFTIPQDCFDDDAYSNATLYVPEGTKSKYMATNYWSFFDNIVEGEPTGISYVSYNQKDIQAHDGIINVSGVGDGQQIAIYQVDGKQVATAKAYNGSASVATCIGKGTTFIVKIGDKAVKVVMR